MREQLISSRLAVICAAAGLVLAWLGAHADGDAAPATPPTHTVALELIACGVGPGEFAALGCSESETGMALAAVRAEATLFEDLRLSYEALGTLDSQIGALKRRLRVSPEPQDLLGELQEALTERDRLVADIRATRSELREVALSSVAASSPLKDRIVSELPDARRLPAPWRANQNTPARHREIAAALDAANRADEAGTAPPPQASVVLAQEQARADTATALSNDILHTTSATAAFLGWMRPPE